MYQCRICGNTFNTRKGLRKHLTFIHILSFNEMPYYIVEIKPRVPIDESEDINDIEVMLTFKE